MNTKNNRNEPTEETRESIIEKLARSNANEQPAGQDKGQELDVAQTRKPGRRAGLVFAIF